MEAATTEQTEQTTTESAAPAQAQPRNPEGQGALFKNDKGDNPKRPDYRGRCTIDGVERQISAWLKTDRTGKHYMSLAFRVNPDATQGDPVLGG